MSRRGVNSVVVSIAICSKIIKLYYEVAEGSGGIFSLPVQVDNASDSTNAIGTNGCENCVGVYVALDNKKCFAAHVFAHMIDYRNTGADVDSRCPDASVAEKLKRKIISLLERDVRPHVLYAEETSPVSGKAIAVCPRMTESGRNAVGRYVVEALESFFGFSFPIESANGFTVDNVTQQRDLFKFSYGPGDLAKDVDFDERNQDIFGEISDRDYGWGCCNLDDRQQPNNWMLVYRDNEWHVLAEQNDQGQR